TFFLLTLFLYLSFFLFFLHLTAPTNIYTLSLHDALPIYLAYTPFALATREHHPPLQRIPGADPDFLTCGKTSQTLLPQSCRNSRSEEHTSELQSRENLVCRLLLEKKKQQNTSNR